MSANVNNVRIANVAAGTQTVGSIDIGFRWIDSITIEFDNEIPGAQLQLKMIIAGAERKYEIRKGGDKTIHRASEERIACGNVNEFVIGLYEYRRKYWLWKTKVPILSKTVSLQDDVLYTEETFRNDNGNATITLIFAYSPGGELRDQVEKARRITEEQKVVLDKIRHVHRFFQGLEKVCEAVEDTHPYIKTACTAILSLYKLCETQKECRDAARELVDELSGLLDDGAERLSSALRIHSHTKRAFKSVSKVVSEILEFVEGQRKGMVGSLLDSLSSKSRIEELREKMRKVRGGLNDSITYGIWELAVDNSLKNDLKFVSNAHYRRGEGCLPGTRVDLLAGLDTWVRDPNAENTAWVHGYAGSGKSSLLNSIARKLEDAYIPFTCFTCKRDDAECSDVQRILPTLSYDLTRYYGDYFGEVSNVLQQPKGRSVTTGGVATQMELLFGESPSYDVISSTGARRPPVHIILIDALDECNDVRGRGALAKHLRDLASSKKWIKVLITSRREHDINDVLGEESSGVKRIDINDAKWGKDTDIYAFIKEKSKETKLDLTADQIQQLVKKASGLFVWCATVFRYIEKRNLPPMDTIDAILSCGSPSPTKDKPFKSLYELYQRVLDSAASDSEDKALVESILGVIYVASERQPLSADAIADILYPNEADGGRDGKRKWVGYTVTRLFAIVYVEEGMKVVRVCHPSVLDFVRGMLNESLLETMISGGTALKPFPTRLVEIHKRVIEGCLLIMGHDLHFNMCGLEDSFRLNEDVSDLADRIKERISEALQYACSFWASHLVQSGSKESAEKVYRFLNSRGALFWVEALSLLGIVDQGIVALQDCTFFFPDAPDVADIANEWERFLLAYGDALKSTPHLYLSALSWLPRSSRLWDVVHNSFSSELPIVTNVQKTWNSERWSDNVGAIVESVAYSSDGRLFAAGDLSGRVRFWEARSGKVAREPFVSNSDVFSVAFSPDDRWLASGHLWGNNIRLWDLHAESAVPRVLLEGYTDFVFSVAFSSDGRRIVSGSGDKSIRVWDVESGTAIGDPFTGHDHWVTSVTFSANDTRIVSGSQDNTVRIWDSETGKQIGEALEGRYAACSRDGRFIVSGSFDGSVRLWDAQTYKQIGDPLTRHPVLVRSVCLSADSKLVASCSDDNSIRIWSVETRSLISDLRGHMSYVNSIAFSSDGRSLLSGSSDYSVRAWDVRETATADQSSVGHSAEVLCLSYVPECSLIVSGSSDGYIYRWDAHTGAAFGTPMRGHTSAVNTLAVSSDGRWIVSGSSDKTLRMWDVALGTSLGEPMLGHTDQINSVSVSSDNQLVASASDDKTVRLWDVATHNLVITLEGHDDSVTSVVFSVDGGNVISGSKDKTIRTWDTRTGKVFRDQLGGHSRAVLALAVSADGNWIASGSEDSSLRIWDMATLSEVHVIDIIDVPPLVAFTPDSKFLVFVKNYGNIEAINIQTGEVFAEVPKHYIREICSLSCSPNGHEIASGLRDGTIRVCNLRAGIDIELYNEDDSDEDDTDEDDAGEDDAGEDDAGEDDAGEDDAGEDDADKDDADYSELGEEELRILWNASQVHLGHFLNVLINDDGWIRSRGNWNLLLWVPMQYRRDLKYGAKLVIGAPGVDTVRPEVDYRKLFGYSGARWADIYNVRD